MSISINNPVIKISGNVWHPIQAGPPIAPDLSEIKVCVPWLGKETTKMFSEDKGNTEWIEEESSHKKTVTK